MFTWFVTKRRGRKTRRPASVLTILAHRDLPMPGAW